jgi:hypothetical protein
MATTGRPTKLDDLTAKRIVDAVRAGNTRQCAAQLGGIHKATLLEWLARGRKGEQPFADFADRIARADAEAEAEMVSCVRDAGGAGPLVPGGLRSSGYSIGVGRPGGARPITRETPRQRRTSLRP